MNDNWQLKIEELDLSHQHLVYIQNLEKLTNLRMLNPSYNRIENI